MPRWRHLRRAESFNACWPFPTNDSHVPWWAFSHGQRLKRCWRRRIERLGWDVVTMLSCSPPFRPASDYPRNAQLAADSAREGDALRRQRDGGAAQVQYAAARLVAGGNLPVDRRAVAPRR